MTDENAQKIENGDNVTLLTKAAKVLPAHRRAARSLPCPFCGARTGAPCRSSSGRATYEHADRSSLTRLAQNIGYEEGLRDALMIFDWKAPELGGPGLDTRIIRDQIQIQYDMATRGNLREEAIDG